MLEIDEVRERRDICYIIIRKKKLLEIGEIRKRKDICYVILVKMKMS